MTKVFKQFHLAEISYDLIYNKMKLFSGVEFKIVVALHYSPLNRSALELVTGENVDSTLQSLIDAGVIEYHTGITTISGDGYALVTDEADHLLIYGTHHWKDVPPLPPGMKGY